MNDTRICTICKEIKPFSEFHWDKRWDLPFSRCKPCFNERCRQYRASKAGKENYKRWKKTPRGKEVCKKRWLRWIEKHPEKAKAVWTVNNALRDGRIFKTPCVVCGEIKVEAHHHSYKEEDRLNVTWLCKKHHVEITFKK